MLARNLTSAFSEQLRAVMSNNNSPQQQVLEEMEDQIKNLRERIEHHQEIPKSHESQDGNLRMSHSSKRNKKRRERSRTHTSLNKTDPRDDESKTASRDARTYLESKKQSASESVQSLVDKRREERKKAQLAGSSRPISPVTMSRNEAGKSSLPEDLIPITSPLAPEILNTPNPGKIKIPNMAAFDGTSCPEEHLMAYKNLMLLYTTNPSLWCKFFPTTLTRVALTWYTSLLGGSIHNFAQLEGKFLGHFVASRRQEKSNFHLLSIMQLEGESISSYLKKFHEAVLEAHDPKKRRSEKKDSISNHSSRNREEHSSRRDENYMPRRPEPPSDMGPPRSRHVYVVEGESRTRNLLDGGNDSLFNRNRKDIFFAIRDQLPTPPLTTTPFDRRNYNLWCDYHKEHDHTLAQCRELKRNLDQLADELLADEEKLSMFINRKDYDARGEAERRPWNQRRRSPKRDKARRESSNTQGTINMIFGGYTEQYPTIRAARNNVHTLLKGPPKASSSGPTMMFDATTSQTLQQPHTEPLVVTFKIGQMKVKRVLVDTGSTADLITMECLRKMKFERKALTNPR
ncbi:uncharacterized protein LOC130804449 [Amaranthus tricolor]|uniref:uncharacterized protein LOC130804449 n=1 Tax=Amaranthus tricolor TaxID=29722 RepID=UPI00258996E5|nr:uncharacterized protein LOC130804449 [Amaranthus tricolor]